MKATSRISMVLMLLVAIAGGDLARPHPAQGSSDEQLRLSATPDFSRAPAVRRIQMRVEPADAHRAIEITTDSGEDFRSSAMALAGENASQSYELEYCSVPAGTDPISVTAIGADGKIPPRLTPTCSYLTG